MEVRNDLPEATVDLIDGFRLAIREDRVDEAEVLLDELRRHDPVEGARPLYATMVALGRDDARGALQALYGADDAPELRAVCLRVLGDPTWEGLAGSLADESEDRQVRAAMRNLLGRDDEEADAE
jgi:type III secretion protein HrpB1